MLKTQILLKYKINTQNTHPKYTKGEAIAI